MSGVSSEPRVGSWWSPSGWAQAPWPDAYWRAWNAEGMTEALSAEGYEEQGGAVPDDREMGGAGCLVLRRHPEHLAVETWDYNQVVSVFFVADADIPAFRATLLPSMVQSFAAAWMAEEVRIIRRAIVAFVRHGHGTKTVAENGLWDADERQRERDRLEARRAAERAGKGDAP